MPPTRPQCRAEGAPSLTLEGSLTAATRPPFSPRFAESEIRSAQPEPRGLIPGFSASAVSGQP